MPTLFCVTISQMPDVLVYSTCNQFAHGVLAITARPEKLVRSRIGAAESYRRSQISSVIARGFLTARKMALCKSGESEIWRRSRIYFCQRVETTCSTFAKVDRLLLKPMPRRSPEAQHNVRGYFQQRKLRRAACQTRLRCSAEFLLCLK